MHGQRDVLDSLPVAPLDLQHVTGEGAAAVAHLLDVATCGECTAGAGQHQHRNLLFPVHPVDCFDQVVDQCGSGQRIAHVIAIEGKRCHPALNAEQGIFKLRELVHWCLFLVFRSGLYLSTGNP